MKTILLAAATAFCFATPAAAQSAQPQQVHQQHGPHQSHSQHQGQAAGNGHAGHSGHTGHTQHEQGHDYSQQGKCCGDANGNGKMDCCEGTDAAQRPCCAKHAPHGASAQPQNL
jgi:opacity protein-like surface antigen